MPRTIKEGIKCPKCESTNFKCKDTWQLNCHIRRYKQCTDCGNNIITVELHVEGTAWKHKENVFQAARFLSSHARKYVSRKSAGIG